MRPMLFHTEQSARSQLSTSIKSRNVLYYFGGMGGDILGILIGRVNQVIQMSREMMALLAIKATYIYSAHRK